MLHNRQMLGTDALALAALDTIAGFSELMGQLLVIGYIGSPSFVL